MPVPFTVNQTETSYANLSGKIHGLSFRSSYLNGHDNLALEAAPNQYDYTVFDANAEYALPLGKIGTLAPGVSYQSAIYGDKDYLTKGLTFLNGKEQTINTTSGFLRTDLKPVDALRVLAAVRFDKFSSPDKIYFAYEFATTYKINDTNLIRAAVTRSNSGSFIGNNYLQLVVPQPPLPDFNRLGSTDLKLLTVNMIELGYRSQLSKSFQLDFDVFQQKAENFTALITTNAVDPGDGILHPTEQRFLNVPTTATQVGGTISLNFVPNEKIQIKPFITIQKTTTKDLPSDYASTAINPGITYSKSEHQNTPGFYGGYFINYRPITKLTFNLNGYLFTAHRQYDGSDANPNATTDNINGRVLVNLKANWAVTKQFNLYVNCRNLLNSKDREFYAADRTGTSIMGGVSFNMN
ncbi:MAG: TonB-dependent receptor [Chryseolinea sp.]